MASIRLTTFMRENILKDALAYRFNDDIAALAAERAAFAQALYEDIYSEADRKKMASLPKGWLPEVNQVGADFSTSGQRNEVIPFNGHMHGPLYVSSEPVKRRVIERDRYSISKSYEGSHPLAIRYGELYAKEAGLTEAYRAAKNQAHAALAEGSTTGKLKQLWPEIAPFVARFEKEDARLPVVPLANLNEMFRLPVAAE